MAAKPADIRGLTMHISWADDAPFACPLCGKPIEHAFNDGGRRVETTKGPIWVVTNYYRCKDMNCDLNHAFPAAEYSTMKRKKYGVDVWAKVIMYYFMVHMNFEQITKLLEWEWHIIISRGTIRNMVRYFEKTSKKHVDEQVLADVKKKGKIMISLDGSQPVKGEPSLWFFTDRLTGHVLYTATLDSAPAETLVKCLRDIEKMYGVLIVAAITDKQSNIVNAIKMLRPGIKHAYCQYHFLDHVAAPAAAKDTHLQTILRGTVRKMSIMKNHEAEGSSMEDTTEHGIGTTFSPLVEELSCAIAATGDRFKIFPGKETYENLAFIASRLKPLLQHEMSGRDKYSLATIITSLETMLGQNEALYNEVTILVADFNEAREILGHRDWKGDRVRKAMDAWVDKLKKRLERRGLECDPEKLKWERLDYATTVERAWQEWIRLVHAHEDGLYIAYDIPGLDFTNNATEQLIHAVKRHFRSLYGRADFATEFQEHGGTYARLVEIDLSKENISDILIADERPIIPGDARDLHVCHVITRRRWRIREIPTGNIEKFEAAITASGSNATVSVD